MPIYEYRRPDGSTFEVMQAFSDDPLTEDPDTGVPVERVLHAPAVHFKGKGFYNTDYGTRKRQRESASSGDGSSSTGTSEKGSTDTAGSSTGSSAEKGATESASSSTAKEGVKAETVAASAS